MVKAISKVLGFIQAKQRYTTVFLGPKDGNIL